MLTLLRFTKNKNHTVKLLSFIVSISGIAVIMGWMFDISALKSISPYWISMKFDTAVCFLLSGITLYFINRAVEGEFDKAQIVIFITSLVTLLFMGTLFFSMFFGVHTGVEDIFVNETKVSAKTVVPGQPSLLTMINFILISLAGILTILGVKNVRSKLKIIGMAVGAIGLLAVAGYIINVPILYYYLKGLNSAMACHTAILFVILGAGLLCL